MRIEDSEVDRATLGRVRQIWKEPAENPGGAHAAGVNSGGTA
jgi:hypothetical protein